MSNLINVNSVVRLNFPKIRQLTDAPITALEQTAEAVHTEVVQAQVMPFDDPEIVEKRVYGKRGQFAKNGREYKGRVKKEIVHGGGHLQNDSTFVDKSGSKFGKVSIISSTPYARRLYFHPEYHFDTGENPNARGRWYTDWLPGGKEADFATDTFKEIYRRLTDV